jgi:hypothetical protein
MVHIMKVVSNFSLCLRFYLLKKARQIIFQKKTYDIKLAKFGYKDELSSH